MQTFAEVALICVLVPKASEDPPEVEQRALVLYGEGLISSERFPGKRLFTKDRGSLTVITFRGTYQEIQELLEGPGYTNNAKRKTRIVFNLIKRPSFSALIGNPYCKSAVREIHQFVCLSKTDLLDNIAGHSESTIRSEGQSEPLADWKSRIEKIEKYLDEIDALIGREFRRYIAGDLGSIARYLGDVFLVKESPILSDPFIWFRTASEKDTGCSITILICADAIPYDSLMLNCRFFGSDGLAIDDRIFSWTRGKGSDFSIELNQNITAGHLKVWADNKLVFEERRSYFQSRFNLNVSASQEHLNDRLVKKWIETSLPQKEKKSRPGALQQVSEVSKYAPEELPFIGQPEDAWYKALDNSRDLFYHYFRPVLEPHEYFQAGTDGRVAAMRRVASLISQGHQAILLDPFFDALAAEDLLQRIENKLSRLTVITCLPDTHKGSGDELERGLISFLSSAKDSVHANLLIFRHTNTSSQQTFHDRFLIIMTANMPIVFNLSNSISGLAQHYPLLIIRLSAGVAGAVYTYAKDLIEASKGRQIWPLPATKLSKYKVDLLYWAVGWEHVLETLLPRNGEEESTWLERAEQAGWITTELGIRRWAFSAMKGSDSKLQNLRTKFLTKILDEPENISSWDSDMISAIGFLAAHGIPSLADELISFIKELITPSAKAVAIAGITSWLKSQMDVAPSVYKELTSLNHALLARKPTPNLVEFSIDVQKMTLQSLKRRYLGREFAFILLAIIDPGSAVNISETLGDPCIVALFDPFVRGLRLDIQHMKALLDSESPVLRVFAAQSLVSDAAYKWIRGGRQRVLCLDDSFSILQNAKITHIEIATCIILWMKHYRESSECRADLLHRLLSELTSCDVNDRNALTKYMMSNTPAWLDIEFVDALKQISISGQLTILESLIHAFTDLFVVTNGRMPPAFSNAHYLFFLCNMSKLIVLFAKNKSLNIMTAIDDIFEIKEHVASLESATPLSPVKVSSHSPIIMGCYHVMRVITGLSGAEDAIVTCCAEAVDFLRLCEKLRMTFTEDLKNFILELIIVGYMHGHIGVEKTLKDVVALTEFPIMPRLAAACVLRDQTAMEAILDRVQQLHRGASTQVTRQLPFFQIILACLPPGDPVLTRVTSILDSEKERPEWSLAYEVAALRSSGEEHEARTLITSQVPRAGWLRLLLK